LLFWAYFHLRVLKSIPNTLQISTDFLIYSLLSTSGSSNSTHYLGGLRESGIIPNANICWIEMCGSRFSNILSISVVILSYVIFFLKASLTATVFAAWNISRSTCKLNLYANLITLRTRRGSSTKVSRGSSGVLATWSLKS